MTERATQYRLFPFEQPELMGSRVVSGNPHLKKPRRIKPENSFETHAPSIYPGCINSINGELSYGKGVDFWTKQKDKLIKRAVLGMHLDPLGSQEAEDRIKAQMESNYASLLESLAKYEPRGVEFYRQAILRHKNLRDVTDTSRLGLMALTESDKEEDPALKKELETQGFILLQIAHEIALRRHGIYGQDPSPAFASTMQYSEREKKNGRAKKIAKKEAAKIQKAHGQREDTIVNSLGHYANQYDFWTRKFFERFGGEATPYDDQFKEKFERDLRAAGGTKEMRRTKEHPSYFENALLHAEDLNAFTLLGIALQAIYNPSRRRTYPRRSENAGIKLLLLAYEKAGDDPRFIENFKGYYEYIFRKVYLHLKGTVQSKTHVKRNEAAAMIARSRGLLTIDTSNKSVLPASDEELSF